MKTWDFPDDPVVKIWTVAEKWKTIGGEIGRASCRERV